MENRGKKIFLLLSITVPFLIYCIYYYGMMVKNAPYKFVEFDHVSIQWGTGDSLLNYYNSKTGNYQYLNKKDSLIKTKVPLDHNDLLYLHRKAADLGFWDFPANETLGKDTTLKAGPKTLRYIIEFAYERKTKRVVFDANFNGNEKLIDANQRLIKEIQGRIDDKEERLKR
ncbi:hypothetical protein [Mucilaginibacter myungsuensis]|uniref:Uncharacterized protein n=1 Tax=Mucilaginibacter myungsuensis TaxID=649104 RepID=A0A929KXV4_9SPHI|nr:hypothetical protein [Mucilaginibacter myungsuensis]MBE9663671.1 hypothetical protein [Mucilaginibacter myungsuensis]MDN3599005.1 hypothetical protein [Mucilaginibacter myungsuensis]